MSSSEIKEEFTNRGFRWGNFTDALGEESSIQESSSATEERIWLGLDEPKLTAMSINVSSLPPIEWIPNEGSTETTGWSTAVLPKDVHIFGRMELTREMCGQLGKILTHFAETGELSFDEKNDDPSRPMRNCDCFSNLKAAQKYYIDHGCPKGLGFCVDGEIRKFPWKSQF